jgi:hypothetical protein
MKKRHLGFNFGVLLVFGAIVFASAAAAQRTKDPRLVRDAPVIWEPVHISSQDLYFGSGGKSSLPDLSRVTFLKEEKGGHSKKYELRDGAGERWVAKIGIEAQPETAAVRLLSAIGYKTELVHLVPRLTIPGKGTFSNVRLEARPEGVKRGDAWKWGKNSLEGTRDMDGLKLMMAFIANWDTKNSNNEVLTIGNKQAYIVSDLGSSFGKTGKVGWPLFWRFGRSRNKPADYVNGKFISGVKNGRPDIYFNGVNRGPIRKVSAESAVWLAGLLNQLSDRQIRDAFEAANYSKTDVELLTSGVRKRIAELNRITLGGRLGRRQ